MHPPIPSLCIVLKPYLVDTSLHLLTDLISRLANQAKHLDAISLHQFDAVNILTRSTEGADLVAPLVLERALSVISGVRDGCGGEEVVVGGREVGGHDAVGVGSESLSVAVGFDGGDGVGVGGAGGLAGFVDGEGGGEGEGGEEGEAEDGLHFDCWWVVVVVVL